MYSGCSVDGKIEHTGSCRKVLHSILDGPRDFVLDSNGSTGMAILRLSPHINAESELFLIFVEMAFIMVCDKTLNFLKMNSLSIEYSTYIHLANSQLGQGAWQTTLQ